MSVTDSLSNPGSVIGRLRQFVAGKLSSRSGKQMGNAAVAFAIRIAGAGLGFGLQVLLARLLDLKDYGLYVTFWTWLFVIGQISAFGFNDSVLRFLPRYTSRGRHAEAVGFMRTGLAIVLAGSATVALLGLAISGMVFANGSLFGLDGGLYLLLVLLFIGIPILAFELYLEGISRSFGWFALAIFPAYVARPVLMAVVAVWVVLLYGSELSAAGIMTVALSVTGLITLVQAWIVKRRLAALFPANGAVTRSKRKRRLWLKATLPLILVYGIEEFYYATDVLLLGMLADPAEVGIYFAAVRIMALSGYVYYAFFLISSREFSLAKADRDQAELQRRALYATRWTFLLTVPAVLLTLAAGWPLLSMFGSEFVAGWPVLLVIGLGLIARASVGQAGDLLMVLGHQREIFVIAAIGLIGNAVLTILLVPYIGILGAAVGTAVSMAIRAGLLRYATLHRAGLETSVFHSLSRSTSQSATREGA